MGLYLPPGYLPKLLTTALELDDSRQLYINCMRRRDFDVIKYRQYVQCYAVLLLRCSICIFCQE